MQQPTDDETAGLKDRERPRPNPPNTRQNLGAVGRVASRVRNSGMSRLSKANSFLLRQKEEESANENESPWGAGVSTSKADNILPNETGRSNEQIKLQLSHGVENKSDVIELSSPLSADQNSSTPLLLDATPQNTSREENRPRKRTSDRVGHARGGNDRKPEKRSDRASAVLGAAGAARGLVKSVSKFGFRVADRKGGGQGTMNDLARARSAMAVPAGDVKETKHSKREMGKGILIVTEETKTTRVITRDSSPSLSASDSESVPDTKIRGFHLPGLGRSKNRLDDVGKPKTKPRKSGLARSISQAPSASPRSDESPKGGPDSGKSGEGKRSRLKKPFKESEQKARKNRGSWFGFSGDAGESQTRGARGKSRDRRLGDGGDQDADSEVGSGMNGRASKDLAEMQDFAVDEYFDSDEDDMEIGSAPRSMVDDDFITYQTGKGKKAQGNRSKNRMKPQS